MPRKFERESERRMANRKADVAAKLASLKGRSEANIMGDQMRGPASPLGKKKMERNKL